MVCRTATFGVANLLRFWNYTAFARFGRFIGTRIQCDFPLSVLHLFPYCDVASGDKHWLPVSVLRSSFVMPPCKSHVVGRTHLCSFRHPAQLVLFWAPLRLGSDSCPAHYGKLSIVEGQGVVGEPACKGLASAFGDSLSELS